MTIKTDEEFEEWWDNRSDTGLPQSFIMTKEWVKCAWDHQDKKIQSQLEQVTKERDEERCCVDWYADEINQLAPIYKPTGKPGADFTQPYRMDGGKRAREQQTRRKDANC